MNALVDEILETVKIAHLKDRMPTQLSGGQQQRVALAQAIVIHPQVLLMDEPLSILTPSSESRCVMPSSLFSRK